MKMTSELGARAAYMKRQYRLADERDEDLGLGQVCILCRVGIPGGTGIGNSHHEIISKAQLRGPNNWERLFALENIARACPTHHAQLGHLRPVWLKGMVALGLARAEQYRVEPFRVYWVEEAFPPVMGCVGQFGYGSRYFNAGAPFPESLKRLYKVAHPAFDENKFCDFCIQRKTCLALTENRLTRIMPATSVTNERAEFVDLNERGR